MQRSVPLDNFPDGLRFPPEFDGRIQFDAVKRVLRFDGFMSKSEFDQLTRLHNDYRYQRALEHLFQICTFDDEPRSDSWLVKLVVPVVAIIALAVAIGWWRLSH